MASRYWVGGSGTWGSTASWSTSSGGSSGASVPIATDDAFFDASSDGAGNAAFTVTLGAAATCLSLSFATVDQNVTFTGAFTLSVTGNLIMSATKTISVTGITSLAMTSATSKTITSSGGTLTGDITFSAAGPFTLQDAFTSTGTVIHTAGTIAFNGFTLTSAAYSNTGTTTRALNFTTSGSKFSINSTTTATVWSIASSTGLTVTSPTTGSVDIIGSSNVTRTIDTLALAEASTMNFNILATAGTTTVTASNTFRNLVVNGVGGTFSNIAITVYGNLSYLGGTWQAGANLLTLAPSSGSFTITGTGGALDFPITFNSTPTGAGAYTLASNVTIGATASRQFFHQQGTLNLSTYTLTVYGVFNSSSTATRTLNFGTGFIDLTLDGSTATTIWDSTTTSSWTVTNAATGSIRVKGSGSLVRSINTGGLAEATSLSFEFLSSAGTITLTNARSWIRNFTINCSGTTISNAVISCFGNFTYTAGTLSAGANTLRFDGTSGTQTISSAGTFDFPVQFFGTGTYSLSTNLSIGTTTSRDLTLTTGTLELNSRTITVYGRVVNNGTGTRKIQMSGTGGKIVLSLDTAATVWDTGTVTGLTTDGNVLVQLTGAGATTKSINASGALSETNAISFQLSNTAGTVAFVASSVMKNLTIDNNSFTLTNVALTIYGNFSIAGTSPTLTAGANAWTFAATSSKTITTNGATLDFPLIFSGVAGTWTLGSALSVGTATSRTVTLTTGTLDLSSYTFTIFGIFSSSGTGTRKIQMSGSGGKIVLSLNTATTVCDTSTVTNLTTDGNVLVQLTGGGAVTKTINAGQLSETSAISFQLSCTAGTVSFTGSNVVKNLTIDNNSFTVSNIALTIYGNLLISGITPTLTAGGNTWTFASQLYTTVQTITTSGKTLDFPIIFNGLMKISLLDALTVGTATSRTVTLSNGTLELNSYTLTIFGVFNTDGSGSRRIQMSGSGGKIVLSLNTATTVFDAYTTSNITTDGNIIVQLTGGGAVTKTINVGAASSMNDANSISFQLSCTAGTVSFTAANTVKNLTIDNTSFTLSNAVALTIYGNLTINGATPTLTAGTNAFTFAGDSGASSSISYRYLRWNVTAIRTAGQLMQATEFRIQNAGVDISMTGSTVTASAGNQTNQGPSNLVDTNVTTKYCSTTTTGPWTFTIDLGSTKTFDSYRWATGDDQSGRDPITWTLEVSSDNSNWTTVSTVSSYATSANRGYFSDPLYVNAGSITKTITTSGKTLDFPVTFNSIYRSFNLQDALTIGATRVTTLTAGTLNLNGFTCTAAGGFAVTGTGTKVLAHGAGDLVVSLAGATAFNASGTRVITDGSSNAATVTNNGTVTYNSLTPFGRDILGNSSSTGGSILFNGTNQYLSAVQAAGTITTGTFTIEAWVYPTSLANQPFVIEDAYWQTGHNGGWYFAINTNGTLQLGYSTATFNAYTTINSTGTVSINKWSHIAVVRDSSNNINFYINGVLANTPSALSQSLNLNEGLITRWATRVGCHLADNTFLNGFTGNITNARIVVGTAVYTANFTPAPVLQAITNTLFLLQVASSANIITDSSTNAYTVTNNNTAVYSYRIPFNEGDTSGSLSFNGTSQYLTVPYNSAWSIPAGGAFSLEAWIYITSSTGGVAIIDLNWAYGSSGPTWALYIQNAGSGASPQLGIAGTGQGGSYNMFAGTSNSYIPLNQWTHIAVTRNSTGAMRSFINGNMNNYYFTALNTGSGQALAAASGSLYIGVSTNLAAASYFNGLISNIRFINGSVPTGYSTTATVLGTQAFTPPTSELTAVSGTSLLIKQDDNSAGTLTSTGTGKISMTSASSKTFLGNRNSYATINQGGAGELTIVGSNSFQNITNSVQPATIKFTAGTTSTFTNGFSLAGTAGNLITLGSNILAPSTLSKASGTVSVSYCTISYSTATGGASWLAPTSSGNVDGGNNIGWSFAAVLTATAYLGMMAFF